MKIPSNITKTINLQMYAGMAILAACGNMIDPGGSVRDVTARAATFEGQPAIVCMSACTLLATAPGGCITKEHSLMFHGASNPSGGADPKEWEEKVIAPQYARASKALAEWYLDTGRHGEHWLSGDVLINKFGLTECDA